VTILVLRMRPDVEEAWARELLSGRHRQGQCLLERWTVPDERLPELLATGSDARTEHRTVARRCCLGVLCRLAEANEVPLVVERFRDTLQDSVTFDGAGCLLPRAVLNWAFDVTLPETIPDGDVRFNALDVVTDQAVEVNDDQCLSFPEIAELIGQRGVWLSPPRGDLSWLLTPPSRLWPTIVPLT
jgi:hypothetical protein